MRVDVDGVRAAIEKLEALPCTCDVCRLCHGTGSIAVNYDAKGRFVSIGMQDDLFDLEPCDNCREGITLVCERCRDLEELEQLLDENQ